MIKLNLGSKYRKLPGFDNLDKIFGWLFQNGLPQYADSSVDGITISHALMFLTSNEVADFVYEAYRALKPNGVIRITEDDTQNSKSVYHKTGNVKSGPKCLTGPKMMRQILEKAGFIVHDVDRHTTHFKDKSLMQAYRGGQPNYFFIEGIKTSNLLEGIKNTGRPYEIPNVSRDDLPRFFIDLGFRVGAEIGVYKGEFSQKLAKSGLSLYAIDPWMAYVGTTQRRQDKLHDETKKLLSPYPNCTVVRKASMEALDDFKDNSLDFVYIDANHEFRYVAEDIAEWTKKVKPGGIVSGHDYFYTKTGTGEANWHVAYVLKAYIGAFGIPNWYLLGRKESVPGEKRDKWRSWMFVKS